MPTTSGSWSRKRTRFTNADRTRIIKRANGHCQTCGQPSRHLEADHRIPCAEGGTSTLDNGQALCPICHARKTRQEIKRGQQRHSRLRPVEKHPGLRRVT